MISDSTYSRPFHFTCCDNVVITQYSYNADTLALLTDSCMGISQRADSKVVRFTAVNYIAFDASYAKGFEIYGSILRGPVLRTGTLLKAATVESCLKAWPDLKLIDNDSGFNTTKIKGASGVGLTIRDSNVELGSGDISDCGSHGIEANKSKVYISEALAGSGNTGAGIYAHSGSIIHIKDGTPPTLTGTVGDLAIASPLYEDSSWSDIDGGSPISITAEATVAKEV
jgi:hypothetical protein